MLTRLNGAPFALNPDLIERAEATPDTVITLVDGKHYLVEEPLHVVIERMQHSRAAVLAEVAAVQTAPHAQQAPPAAYEARHAERRNADDDASQGEVIPMRRNP
jgi:flagellar protein FlbD